MYLQAHIFDTSTHKLFNYRMKFILLTASTAMTVAIIKDALFPNFHLVVLLGIAISTDFISGVMKSVALKQPIISQKLRRTVNKFMVYGLSVVVSYLFRALLAGKGEVYDFIGLFLNNAWITFLIYIELVSVLENIIAIDSDGWVTKIAKPVHLLLTFELKGALAELLGKEYDRLKKKP